MEKSLIDEKTIENLLELSRIEIKPAEKEKMADDLSHILSYVNELEKIPTDNINIDLNNNPEKPLRTDEPRKQAISNNEQLINSFNDRKEKWLKIPPVFDR